MSAQDEINLAVVRAQGRQDHFKSERDKHVPGSPDYDENQETYDNFFKGKSIMSKYVDQLDNPGRPIDTNVRRSQEIAEIIAFANALAVPARIARDALIEGTDDWIEANEVFRMYFTIKYAASRHGYLLTDDVITPAVIGGRNANR